MPETRYALPVGVDTRIRYYHRTERGRVVAFMVQLEVEVENEWRPVIRYDTAHGFVHIDRFTRQGEPTKERLSSTHAEALTRAERDIKQNWATFREKFLRGEVL